MKNLKKDLKQHLKNLTALTGVSGSEQEVVKYLKKSFEPLADEVEVDDWGNIIAKKEGNGSGPELMISAHSDEIGMAVKTIQNDGFIRFDKVGGVNDVLLPGRKVLIKGEIPGVIGIKPGHLMTDEEKSNVKSIKERYIDVGASSKEEVRDMGINIGDRIVFQSDFMELGEGDLISTKSVDNRVSCAILLELFDIIDNEDFKGDLYGVVSVQEEIGTKGIFMVGNKIEPDYAIVLDTMVAGDTPEIDTDSFLPIRLGDGPVCPLIDGSLDIFLQNVVHPKVKEIIEEQANKIGVNIQYTTLSGERWTTDASNLSLAGEGIPLGLLTTPRRYSHSPVEIMNINDALDGVKVLKEILKTNGEKEISFL